MFYQFIALQADFDAALAGAGDKVVVIDFTASWCGPCKVIGPKFEVIDQGIHDRTAAAI